MTAVLAYVVGENCLVHGIDIGPSTYGSPISLGDSAEILTSSILPLLIYSFVAE